MPIYEYECPKCGRFESFQKVGDAELVAKPDCTDPECPQKARRLISAPSLMFKGNGFYKTDYCCQKTGKSEGESGACKEGKNKEGSSCSCGEGSKKT